MQVTIYHNPRCSKSRATLALLRDNNIEPKVIEYLKTPPSLDELERVLDLLGLEPRELMRRDETVYHELGLDDSGLDRQGLIAALRQNPVLMQRPVVIAGDKAAIGRPPERVLEIL